MSKDKKFDIEELFYNITMGNSCGDNCFADKYEKDEKYVKCNKEDKYEKYDKCDKKDKYEKNEKWDKCDKKDEKFDKYNKHDEYDKCDKERKEHKSDCSKNKDICIDPCELCKTVKAEPLDLEKKGARLLTVKVRVNNVCFNKKVAIAVIIYDKCHRIISFKGFIAMACQENKCDRDECGSIERKLIFVIPDQDLCDPLELDVRVLANYVYPCECKY